jgi:hypothetical protein
MLRMPAETGCVPCAPQNATEELARMEAAFDAVKRQLFDQLHDVVRARIFYVRRAPTSCLASLHCSLRCTHPRVIPHAC